MSHALHIVAAIAFALAAADGTSAAPSARPGAVIVRVVSTTQDGAADFCFSEIRRGVGRNPRPDFCFSEIRRPFAATAPAALTDHAGAIDLIARGRRRRG